MLCVYWWYCWEYSIVNGVLVEGGGIVYMVDGLASRVDEFSSKI